LRALAEGLPRGAAADFLISPNQSNPSPDAWPQYAIVDANREQWQAPDFVNLLIAVVHNQGRLVLHSWGGRVINLGRSAILAWQSPLDGNVTIAGSISLPSLAECDSGSGTLWSIDNGATTVQAGVPAAGGAASFNVSANVQHGDTICFVLSRDALRNECGRRRRRGCCSRR
jgi:hypothetical protein